MSKFEIRVGDDDGDIFISQRLPDGSLSSISLHLTLQNLSDLHDDITDFLVEQV